IEASGGAGKSGLTGGRREKHSPGSAMSSSFSAIRSCDRGSHTLGPTQRVAPDEPTAVILHGGISEGGGPARSTETLNGHEAGNGGNGQGNPIEVPTILLYSEEGLRCTLRTHPAPL